MENLEIKKLDGMSMDVVAENKRKLMELFPEVFTEEGIILDKLKTVFGEYVEDKDDYYNFTWNGKDKALRLSQAQSTGTLRPCKEESKNWDTTQNLYIEGDNLEVLMLLRKAYHGKVKMIYIDPPYNTGKDFVYKDNYKDNLKNYLELTKQVDADGNKWNTNSDQNGRYHTDWLNMMYPRLRIARDLLNNRGGIFISIDDNELYNLKKVCDEIFGEANFIGTFIINSSPSAIDYGHIAKMNDYALFYAKDIEQFETKHLTEKEKVFKYSDSEGEFNIYPLYNGNVAFNPQTRPNLHYPFYLNPEGRIGDDFYEISLEKNDNWIEVYPVVSAKDGISRVWRWGREKASKELNKEIIGYKTNNGEYRVVQKTRLTGKMIRSLQLDTEISSRRGTKEVQDLFGRKVFDFPKPTELIKRFSAILTEDTDIILDFFSGAATTTEAIMKLNAEDGNQRRFIMVQLPEIVDAKTEAALQGYSTLCEIGKERIRRAGDKIIDENKDKAGIENLDIGFKVFKLESSNIKKWDANNQNLEDYLSYMVDNFVEGRTEEDVLYEIILKYGIDLTAPIESRSIAGKNVYSIGFGALFVCLDMEITVDVVEGIVAYKDELEPARTSIIFRDNGFKDSTVKTNALQILRTNDIEEVMSI